MKKILICLLWLCTCVSSLAQAYGELPTGYIGTVNQTATGTYQLFSYSWTAPTTGADYVGIALRQDPGYWSVGSFSLTAQGSSTNLLNNPNLQYGGTTSTQYGLQAPADWGLWYQSGNGAPPAAGMYYAPGTGWMGSTTLGGGVNTSTAGSWIDGAVGTYDGIYQGFSATAGTTYNFSFYSSGTNSYSNPSIMIGVYAGACSGGIFSCTPVTNAFTIAATPQQTQGTGGAPPPTNTGGSTPTVVSTTTTNQTSTTTSRGNTTYSISYTTRTVYTTNSSGNQIVETFTDTVSTPVTPVYTTTTTTPVTTTTYSDGSTTTSNGTPTSTTTTSYEYGTATTSYASTPTTVAPWICCGGSSAPFNADSGKVQQIINFAGRNSNDSQVYITQIGNNANIAVTQTGTKNSYAYIYDNGSFNNINVTQSSTSPTATNYSSTTVNGDNNHINITQQSTGGAKAAFVNVSNNSNTVNVSQTDSGNHWADISLTGGNKTVNLTQSGSAGQMASIQMSGTPTSLTLQQSGATQNFYAIQFNCATAGGCAPINVKQGN
jgi:hypothetical protein